VNTLASIPEDYTALTNEVSQLTEEIEKHTNLLFCREEVAFSQGWIRFPSGNHKDTANRCKTDELRIAPNEKVVIEPNGMYYVMATINPTTGEASLYYPDWVSNGQIAVISFDDETQLRIAVKMPDDADISPNDVTANVYIEKIITNVIENDVRKAENQIHELQKATSYHKINAELVGGYVLDSRFFESTFATVVKFSANVDQYYRINLNCPHNRFIVYGSSDQITYEEVGRIATNALTNNDTYTYYNEKYPTLLVQCWYSSSETPPENIDPLVFTSDSDNFEELKIEGVHVVTHEDLNEVVEILNESIENVADSIENISFDCELTNVKNEGNISNDGKNLCLVCQKQIYKNGESPDVSGYLYLDIYEGKFYYSSPLPDNPKYLCDWKTDVAYSACQNSTDAQADRWHFSITKDGDIICLLNYKRCAPIIYPHGDYNNPVIVEGITTNPYGLLTQQSIVQMDDGTFYFGEYAVHSLEDEQNNDRRNIWKVTKPYTDASNWVVDHSFKHVYFTSPESDEPDNEIGHIHSVTFDWYTNTLYANTGDIGRHVRIWRKTLPDGVWSECAKCTGNKQITEDEQKFRVVNLLYTSDACWWATDSFHSLHNLYKADRDANGDIDFATTQKIINLESFEGRNYSNTQPTYINVLMRDPNGILFIDRGEDRVDRKLDIVFYSFDRNKAYICKTLKKVSESNGLFNMGDKATMVDRVGLPNQCAVGYQPFNTDYVMVGGATYIRMNQVDIFNNNPDNYVGALKIKIS